MKYEAAVITVSDKGSRGERADLSGPAVRETLEGAGFSVVYTAIVPDERAEIERELIACSARDVALVVTTGGTGFAPRDVTPEATLAVCERMTPGIAEAMRAASMTVTPRAMLSRQTAGIRGATLIVNLPGSPRAARENLSAVVGALEHGLDTLRQPQRDHDV
jgi:molybdenum cofactor synthesis domain-containing protein